MSKQNNENNQPGDNKTPRKKESDKTGMELHLAAEKGDLNTVKRLIESDNADLNYIDEAGYTPLFRAVMSKQTKCVSLLLENGADPDIQTREGFTPLMAAAESGNTELLLILLDHKANPDLRSMQGATSLHIAASMGHVEIINMLLMAGTDPSIRDNTDIRKILEEQSGQQITLTSGDESMLKGLTALDVAKMCGQAEAAESLARVKH